ncbi:Aromatic-ring hydroxylase-like protein [Corchorus olitorius]|uniref:Squalene monooxygenase n=1 Tax=Corchorus olitorius TaxID=93759 RepID=A0A1R3G188_9ROSI|nr:Aromatic-ring hydroxylase-like protein [Corchorus olitorius]
MICQCLVGAILASISGLVLFYKKKMLNMEKCSISESAADIIIVGAGVSGSALAYTLAKDGRRVKLIETDLTEPDRISGELLQPGGYLKLMELGLEDCVNEIDAQQVLGYALFKDGKTTKLSNPLQHCESDFAGRSFHSGRFIQRMREKSSTLSNIELEEGTVTSLITEKGTVKGVQYKTKKGHELIAKAPLTIVCDGRFSNLRRSFCNPKVDISSYCVALILENCKLPYANHGHVVLVDRSPILFYPISSTEIRCLIEVPKQKVPSISKVEMSHFLKSVVATQIPSELYNAFISAIDNGSIRTIPTRSMPSVPYSIPRALFIEDAFNTRHQLTGKGMTMALSDIVLLRDLLRPLHNLNDESTLCKYLESFYSLPKPTASTRNTLAGALYKVSSVSSDPAKRKTRQACFDYLSLGGVFNNGPIALLSGMNPQPMNLIQLIFSVLLLPFPSFKHLLLGARLISGASNIIFPILNSRRVRRVLFPVTLSAYYRVRPVNL